MDQHSVETAASQDLVCREVRPPMGPAGLLSKIPYVVLGLEDHAVRQQAFVAPLKPFAVLAASLALATIRQTLQDLPAMFGLILACGQAQIQPSTAYHHVCTSYRL